MRGGGAIAGLLAVAAVALPDAAAATLPGANGDVLVAQGDIYGVAPGHPPQLVARATFHDASAAADGTVAWANMDRAEPNPLDPPAGVDSTLYVRSPGGEPRPLLTVHGMFSEVEMLPDGSQVIVKLVSTTLDGVYAVPVDGGEPVELPFRVNDRHLEVSPDGRHIVFERYDPLATTEPGVWIMRSDGSAQRRLLHFAWDYAHYPSFTPDGRRIVYRRSRPWRNDEDRPARQAIHSITLRGTRDRRLTPLNIRERSSPFASPNGKRVVYSLDDRLVTVSVTGGRERPFRTGIGRGALPLDWIASPGR